MRTPMMARLRRAFAIAAAAERPGMPPADELIEIARQRPKPELTRRRVLQTAASAASLALVPRLLHAQQASAPEVVVVGAGIAGLNAAFRLHSVGAPVRVFEAGARVGGRIYSRAGVIAPDLVTELGGELVNTNHCDMRALAAAFDIPLIDLETAQSGPAVEKIYYAAGKRRCEAELVQALQPGMRRLAADGRQVRSNNQQARRRIDRMSLAEYLAGMDMAPWLRGFLTNAYVSEMGGDAAAQSALYFVTTLKIDRGRLDLFQSDEHYSIAGGNQRVVDALATRLEGRIELEHRLESLRAAGSGYELTFAGPNHAARTVRADAVILALPFSLLRQVELRVELPPLKRRAIAELGYGTNAKVFAGLKARVWQGEMITDLAFDQAWDNSRNRPGSAAGLSIFAGGSHGIAMGAGSSADQVAHFAPLLAQVVPALAGQFNGQTARFHWPSYPLTLGSYSCYRPGQWTAFENIIAQPVGGLFFAGEHCSRDFQAYMNGGAESGRIAADKLLRREPQAPICPQRSAAREARACVDGGMMSR